MTSVTCALCGEQGSLHDQADEIFKTDFPAFDPTKVSTVCPDCYEYLQLLQLLGVLPSTPEILS